MSTVTKLDPMHRQRRAMRRNLLRNYRGHPVIMAELAIIHRASHLTGDTKQRLFERGCAQMAGKT